MGKDEAGLGIRRISPRTAEYDQALAYLQGSLSPQQSTVSPADIGTLNEPTVDPLRVDALVVAAYERNTLCGSVVAVPSPGRTALVLLGGPFDKPSQQDAQIYMLQELANWAWEESLCFLEALVLPDALGHASVLRSAGFRRITRLVYLRRPHDAPTPRRDPKQKVEWASYSTETHALFLRAIELSYVQSQDCPELTGLRPTEEVLEGHRPAASFHPELWWIALRDAEPVGVILLNRIQGQPMLEIAYMGVAQPARGQGVADALLGLAVERSAAYSATFLTLAVDRRNIPAQRMYARWGFRSFARTDAWIATPRDT